MYNSFSVLDIKSDMPLL